jgi:hypothetical protein
MNEIKIIYFDRAIYYLFHYIQNKKYSKFCINNPINLYTGYIYGEQVVNINGCLRVNTIKHDDRTSRRLQLMFSIP